MMFAPRSKGPGKDNFLKLNDRESVNCLFRGDFYKFRAHWENNRTVECPGKETCIICKNDPEAYPSFKCRMNLITDDLVSKVWEVGGEVYDTLCVLDKEHDLSKTFVKITRRGLKTKTSYELDVIDQEVPTKIMEKINAIPLLPLA